MASATFRVVVPTWDGVSGNVSATWKHNIYRRMQKYKIILTFPETLKKQLPRMRKQLKAKLGNQTEAWRFQMRTMVSAFLFLQGQQVQKHRSGFSQSVRQCNLKTTFTASENKLLCTHVRQSGNTRASCFCKRAKWCTVWPQPISAKQQSQHREYTKYIHYNKICTVNTHRPRCCCFDLSQSGFIVCE